MKIKYLILILPLIFSLEINASNVEIKAVKNVVKAKISDFNRRYNKNLEIISEPKAIAPQGEILGYFQKIEPKGFIIVAPDDEMTPILGYSVTHDLDWDNDLNDPFFILLKSTIDIKREIIKNKKQSGKGIVQNEWNDSLLKQNYISTTERTIWPPTGTSPTEGWVETLWHQSAPFNASCPYDDVNEGRSAVGCTATAFGQLVNYFAPTSNIGDFTDADKYTSTKSGFTFLIDDECGTNGTPTFSQLNEKLNNVKYPIDETSSDGIIDEFNFACGISIQEKYSAVESLAFLTMSAHALINKFGFQTAEFSGYNAELLPTIKSNIQNARPVLMLIINISIFDPAGHTIVVDGLNEMNSGSEDDLYHLNYGWGSKSYCFWWNLLDRPLPPTWRPFGTIWEVTYNNSTPENPIIENLGNSSLLISNISCDKSWLDIFPSKTIPCTLQPGENLTIVHNVNNWNSVIYPEDVATISIESNDPDDNITEIKVYVYPKSNNNIYANLKVFLEGPFDINSNLMELTLSNVPKSSPYIEDQRSVNDVPSNVVDWVLVQLRDKTNPTNILASRSAFLLDNGQIVDLNGIDPVSFSLESNQYYVSVKHRNHLAVMSSEPIDLSVASNSNNFVK